jgi:hypothetical protein
VHARLLPIYFATLILAVLSFVCADRARAADVWAPTPTTLPTPRTGHSAIVDSLRNRMVIFGGNTPGGPVNTTAVFDLTTHTWTDVVTAGAPGARYDHTAVWDAPHGRMIVFGGTTGTTRLNDTWALDLATLAWTNLTTTGAPPSPRSNHAATIAGGVTMIVYGGTNGATTFGDLFALNTNTLAWSALPSGGTAPEARQGASMTPGGANSVAIFGGAGATTPFLGDTWIYDLSSSTWTPIVSTDATPQPRSDQATAFDRIRNDMVIFGGQSGSPTFLNDTWTFNISTRHWQQFTPSAMPAARSGATLIAPRPDLAVLFGGATPALVQDTWLLDLNAPSWTQVPGPGTPPSARLDQSQASDDAHQRMIVHGGWLGISGTAMNDTWQLTYPSAGSPGLVWSQLATTGTTPLARFGHSATIDPPRNRMLVFGGATPMAFANNDLWSLDLTSLAWTKLTPGGTLPPARNNHAAVYDAAHQRLVIHGGMISSSVALSDTWVYDLVANTWTQVALGNPKPAARSGHWYVSDDARNRMVVGQGSEGNTFYSDSWALDYAMLTWSMLPTTNNPAGRQSISGVLDTPRDRVVTFGGFNNTDGYSDQTWALDLGTLAWTQLSPVGEIPEKRISHAMVYNPERAWAITWGGNDVGPVPLASGGIFYTFAPGPTAVEEPVRTVRGALRLHAWRVRSGEVVFALAGAGGAPHTVRIEVLAMDGRCVASLAGDASRVIRWAPRDARGHTLPSGVYIAHAELAGGSATTKVALVGR